MPKLDQITEEKVSHYPDRLLMIVHSDLHKWYHEDRSVILPLLVILHKAVFYEMTLRGLRHTHINLLDDKAVPTFPPDQLLQILNNFKVKGGDPGLSKIERLKRWHTAIHNIWTVVKVTRGLTVPNEEIQNAHDVIADQLRHHPDWDELDRDWVDAIKAYKPYPQHAQMDDMLEEVKVPMHMSMIISGFPDEITLVRNVVLKTENKVYIQPGITGILRNSIYAHILRVTQFGEEILEEPKKFTSAYDLKLICPHAEEDLLPVSIDDHGFHSMYPVSSAFVCLVGGIVNNKMSLNDADVLVKSGTPDWMFQHIASLLILNHDCRKFLHIIRDQGLGPTAGYEAVYNLILEEHF